MIFKKIWDIWWLKFTLVPKLISAAIVLALLLLPLLLMRGCGKPPKLDEAEIQKGEQAVKERNDKELREILTNSDVREKQIDANLAYAENKTVEAIHEAKEKYRNMNTDELAAELEKRK